MAEINYTSLASPGGQDNNMGGTKQKIYYAPVRDFLAIQKPIAVPVTLEDTVKIVTAHTFKTGFCFKEVYCTLDKGSVDLEPQGERDGKSFKQKAKIFYPGSKVEAIAFASNIKNDNLIVIIPLADGTMIQVGSEDFPAQMSPKFTSATNSGGIKGWEFEIEAMESVNFVYTSTITLVPAV